MVDPLALLVLIGVFCAMSQVDLASTSTNAPTQLPKTRPHRDCVTQYDDNKTTILLSQGIMTRKAKILDVSFSCLLFFCLSVLPATPASLSRLLFIIER